MMHAPVLLEESLRFLNPQPGNFIIDGTVDGGGHARAILEKISPNGTFLGIDWDERMIRNSKLQIPNSVSVQLIQGNYADLPKILEEKNLPKGDFVSPKGNSVHPKADGLLLDLGFSSEQLEGRGFSFNPAAGGEPLRMIYDDTRTPVSELLKKLSEPELVKILREYGEERYAPRIAEAIKEEVRKKGIETAKELGEIVTRIVPGNYERGRIHPATRTFQALRIYANAELENLTSVLQKIREILKPGGRCVILTFHSLEDRIVKHSFRSMEKEGILTVLTKKPIVATELEIKNNPQSRSAKLRAAVMNSY